MDLRMITMMVSVADTAINHSLTHDYKIQRYTRFKRVFIVLFLLDFLCMIVVKMRGKGTKPIDIVYRYMDTFQSVSTEVPSLYLRHLPTPARVIFAPNNHRPHLPDYEGDWSTNTSTEN